MSVVLPALSRRPALLITLLCWSAIVFDGYDLIVYGSVLPVLASEPGWTLDGTTLGVIGSLTFLGMLLGAITAGVLSERFGPRACMLASITLFSICMMGCALAGSPTALATSRLLTGLGLGGLIPTASALLMEYAPPRHRTLTYALALSGIPLGGVLAAMLSAALLPSPGWRALFWIGACPLVLIVPLAWRYLPESLNHLAQAGKTERAAALAHRYGLTVPERRASSRPSTQPLFRGRNLAATLCFWAATFLALLTWYGLGTWLPRIMLSAGYPLGPAIGALLALSIGGTLGSWATAAAGDRFGHRITVVTSFLMVAVSLLALSIPLNPLMLYVLLALAGTGAVSSQVLVNSFVAATFPARPAGALGWSLGVGRTGAIAGPLVVGVLMDAQASYTWSFYLFAACATLGAVAALLVPRALEDGTGQVTDARRPARAQ
ncbi:aromatic acid/H+ symport family MFS transporter [Nonomuraea sp. FMUSA5-5]|uniref:Aromatic acid/H+ symport family MFS transporter n=1 Tax=Nonomuraea composti TaxID=2720023 RepID=A0ABX1BHT9_9ACTN|nr:MFS transporter [Nonomuraea sp. FMUSA5-5]NJP94851.1 aromatic acid/H+ symport family MFS transporter [Nonomuraea sp. FMUSA5-5]